MKRYNAERRCFRGNSYKKGRALVKDLRDAASGERTKPVRRARRPTDD